MSLVLAIVPSFILNILFFDINLQSERSSVISQLKPLSAEEKNYRSIIVEKRKEMEPFHTALGSLRTAESARRSEGLCSSENELDDLVRSNYFTSLC